MQRKRLVKFMNDKELKKAIQEHKKQNLPPEASSDLASKIYTKIQGQRPSHHPLLKTLSYSFVILLCIGTFQFFKNKLSNPTQALNQDYQIEQISFEADFTLSYYDDEDDFEMEYFNGFLSLLEEV